jgi:hypothetical protein
MDTYSSKDQVRNLFKSAYKKAEEFTNDKSFFEKHTKLLKTYSDLQILNMHDGSYTAISKIPGVGKIKIDILNGYSDPSGLMILVDYHYGVNANNPVCSTLRSGSYDLNFWISFEKLSQQTATNAIINGRHGEAVIDWIKEHNLSSVVLLNDPKQAHIKVKEVVTRKSLYVEKFADINGLVTVFYTDPTGSTPQRTAPKAYKMKKITFLNKLGANLTESKS